MIVFTKSILKNFKEASLGKKIAVIFLILIYIFIMVITIGKVDYEITTPGVVSRIDNLVELDSTNDRGNIYTVGVYSRKRITIFEYWLAKASEKIEVVEYNKDIDLNNQDETIAGVISKTNSLNNAIICAYENAGYDMSSVYTYNGVMVAAIYPYDTSKTLMVSDVIVEIEGEKATSELIKSIKDTNERTIKVKRSGFNELQTIKFRFCADVDNTLYRTIYVMDDYTLDNTKLPNDFPTWKINAQDSIGGSGGAMTALSIYNGLTKTDITKGKKIVGTGTIDIFGNVGIIGGLEQKIETACMYDADIFFIPEANWNQEIEELLKTKDLNYKVVATFSDIIKYLEEGE